MLFDRYYRGLALKSGRYLPRHDEAKRDYRDALQSNVDGLIGVNYR